MKYIDAEKLIAKIKELNLVTKTYDEQVAFNNALAMVVEIIDSLQQEHPEEDYDELGEAAQAYANGPDVAWVGTSALECAFKAGAEWKYQKDRGEFAKLKAKEWCNGYDDAISQFVKIPYKPTDWYLTDEEYMCGAQFEEPIPADVELYYKKENKK
ncbi:MAG: hypothetical protein IJ584_08035 [Bacteroidales bacterium]|nr:hypothetical protein [Bacteroidales bacterium]